MVSVLRSEPRRIPGSGFMYSVTEVADEYAVVWREALAPGALTLGLQGICARGGDMTHSFSEADSAAAIQQSVAPRDAEPVQLSIGNDECHRVSHGF